MTDFFVYGNKVQSAAAAPDSILFLFKFGLFIPLLYRFLNKTQFSNLSKIIRFLFTHCAFISKGNLGEIGCWS